MMMQRRTEIQYAHARHVDRPPLLLPHVLGQRVLRDAELQRRACINTATTTTTTGRMRAQSEARDLNQDDTYTNRVFSVRKSE
jgi:hypothetical protein